MSDRNPISISEAIKRLKEGNQRFVRGESIRPRQDFSRIKEVASSQFPFATIIGCSDSRVPNEIVFDQGLGDLFIIRTAGQVGTDASWGSIEFSVEILGTKLIVVLGHTECRAVKASVEQVEVQRHIAALVSAIKRAGDKVRKQNPA